MKKQLQILALMIRFLILATLLVAAAAALYFWSTWPRTPDEDDAIFIHSIAPRATVVLIEDSTGEK